MSKPPLSFSERAARQQLRQEAFDAWFQRDNLKISGIWFNQDSRLFIRTRGSNSSVTFVLIRYRFLDVNGDVNDSEFRVGVSSDRSITTVIQNIGIGWLLSAFCSLPTGDPRRGQVYINAFVQNAKTGIAVEQLFGDYVEAGLRPAYPEGGIKSTIEGKGNMRSITGTDPAANTEISEAVPTDALWLLKSFRAALVTDANAANRRIRLIIDDGTNELLRITYQTLQTASLTTIYIALWGGEDTAAIQGVSEQKLPIQLFMPAAYRIRTDVVNLQAGDDWGAPQLAVEEWIQD